MHNRDLISLEQFLMKFCVVQSIWITFLGGGKKKKKDIRKEVVLSENIH